jgi:prepilin-type N-terminal cleavage/methylation domain-containing protein
MRHPSRHGQAGPVRRLVRHRLGDGGSLQSEGGFTLIELSVVVFIISVLAALGVPALKKVNLESRSVAVVNDLRVFSSAFQAYAHERGEWPPGNGAPGAFPTGMEGYLGPTGWQRTTPIGGLYTWDPNSTHQGERYRAAIVLTSLSGNPVSADLAQLTDLDRRIDDGDLTTGNFRLGFRNYPVFVIEH